MPESIPVIRKWNVSVQIVLNFSVPVVAPDAQEAAEHVEQMGLNILEYYPSIKPGDVWVNNVTEVLK